MANQQNKYGRVFNFSPGPACLPESVLETVRDEMMNYRQSGMSVMEMSHRSKEFDEILATAISTTKELLNIGDDYEVLFLQGGASLQFTMAPMNLYIKGKPVDFLHTGYWTEMALKELKKGYETKIIYSGEENKFTKIPKIETNQFNPDASYAYMCSNNTIYGTQWKHIPDSGKVPMVVDMSSDFLSRPFDMNKLGLVFAGAQKNLGPSGVVMAIIRKDLAERADEKLPTMLQYRTHIKGGSRYNTPPAFGIYVAGLVLKWIKAQGGLSKMGEHNAKKAKILYDTIDQSGGFFTSPVDRSVRSDMNVVFRVKPESKDSEALETALIAEAKKAGVIEIKGHRAVGGLRASIYNAAPVQGVEALAQVMKEFLKKNG